MKSSSTPRVIWHCDLSLPAHTPKVSRQHALIIYNFQEQYWEIRCLSRKYGVRIGKSKVIRWGDPAVRLSGTGQGAQVISIGAESFVFLVARDRTPQEQTQGPIEIEETRIGVLDEVGPIPDASTTVNREQEVITEVDIMQKLEEIN